MIGKILYVDSAPNFWEKIISAKGKKERGYEGYRYAITDAEGKLIQTDVNCSLTTWVQGEAWGILKAVEWAIENGLTKIKILNDCKFIVDDLKGGNYEAKKHVKMAKEKAKQNNLEMEIVFILSEWNLADKESRVIKVLPSEFQTPKFWFEQRRLKCKNKYIYVHK